MTTLCYANDVDYPNNPSMWYDEPTAEHCTGEHDFCLYKPDEPDAPYADITTGCYEWQSPPEFLYVSVNGNCTEDSTLCETVRNRRSFYVSHIDGYKVEFFGSDDCTDVMGTEDSTVDITIEDQFYQDTLFRTQNLMFPVREYILYCGSLEQCTGQDDLECLQENCGWANLRLQDYIYTTANPVEGSNCLTFEEFFNRATDNLLNPPTDAPTVAPLDLPPAVPVEDYNAATQMFQGISVGFALCVFATLA